MIYISISTREAYLFHYTSLYGASQIIATNEIQAKSMQHMGGKVVKGPYGNFKEGYKDVYGVSLTRNEKYAREAQQTYFVLDQDKIKTKFKIQPLSYWYVTDPDKYKAESEEFVIGPIKPVIPYIVKLRVNERRVNLLYKKPGQAEQILDAIKAAGVHIELYNF